MRRSLAMVLIGSLLAIGASPGSVALAQTDEERGGTGPVVLGGRIEIPSAGFSLEVPEGWYAFDLSAPDLLAEMESFDRTTALLAPYVASVSIEAAAPDLAEAYPDVSVPLLAYAPLDGPTAGESCNMVVEPMDVDSLEIMVAKELLGFRAITDIEGVVPTYLELPTGRLAMAEYTNTMAGAVGLESTVFWLLHDGWAYSLTCSDASRHADRWLAIAESVEFLAEP